MRIDKLNCCVNSILSIFRDFNGYNGGPEVESTAEKTHPRVTTDRQTK